MEAKEIKTIAVIGASSDRKKYSNKAIRAYVISLIRRRNTYKSILDIDDKIDRATLYVPPQVGVKIIEEIAEKGVGELYVNPGAESDELIEKARKLGLNPIMACSILAVGMKPDEDILLM